MYVVATPIGNLGDISSRALDVLKEVDIIFSEDTRVTKKLLSHFDIKTATQSFHARSSDAKFEKIIETLANGKNIALVSDAGTPTISDPGSKLVALVRGSLPETEIISIPGASAAIAALSVSGLPASEFIFLGFMPHKKGREKMISEIETSAKTIVFYESPHRIMKTLESLAKSLDSNRKVVIARELTKIYEEIRTGSAKEILKFFTQNPEKIRGEFVVLVSAK